MRSSDTPLRVMVPTSRSRGSLSGWPRITAIEDLVQLVGRLSPAVGTPARGQERAVDGAVLEARGIGLRFRARDDDGDARVVRRRRPVLGDPLQVRRDPGMLERVDVLLRRVEEHRRVNLERSLDLGGRVGEAIALVRHFSGPCCQRSPSPPTTSAALSPPRRLLSRPRLATATATTISSGRGASPG